MRSQPGGGSSFLGQSPTLRVYYQHTALGGIFNPQTRGAAETAIDGSVSLGSAESGRSTSHHPQHGTEAKAGSHRPVLIRYMQRSVGQARTIKARGREEYRYRLVRDCLSHRAQGLWAVLRTCSVSSELPQTRGPRLQLRFWGKTLHESELPTPEISFIYVGKTQTLTLAPTTDPPSRFPFFVPCVS